MPHPKPKTVARPRPRRTDRRQRTPIQIHPNPKKKTPHLHTVLVRTDQRKNNTCVDIWSTTKTHRHQKTIHAISCFVVVPSYPKAMITAESSTIRRPPTHARTKEYKKRSQSRAKQSKSPTVQSDLRSTCTKNHNLSFGAADRRFGGAF